MAIFKNPFGRKKSDAPQDNDAEMIRVYDKFGREMHITKRQWRTEILPGAIREAWDDPSRLYGVIVQSLEDGFGRDVVDAARRLYETDTDAERAACILGIVLMQEGRLDEAEKVLDGYIARHGETGIILTNLAKVCANRGDEKKAN